MTYPPEDIAVVSPLFPELEAQMARMERTIDEDPRAEAVYRQQVDYAIKQLGGGEEAYRLFQTSQFSLEPLPSRTRRAPNETNRTLFGIYDLPLLNELRRANPLKSRSTAEHVAVVGIEIAVNLATDVRVKIQRVLESLQQTWDLNGDPHA